jgi:D5 N terminal like
LEGVELTDERVAELFGDEWVPRWPLDGIEVSHIRPVDVYFEKDDRGTTRFVPPSLASDIANDLRLVRGPGGGLWYDAGGVFRDGGENLVADCVRHVLGSEYRQNRLAEVLSWCRTLPIAITTTPPTENLLNVANGVLELDTLTLRPVREDERFL